MKKVVRYPMLMSPALVGRLWAGDRLSRLYGKDAGGQNVGESWELSCHPAGRSYIANGVYAGLPLDEYIAEDFAGLVGARCADPSHFPLLIKLIDASQPLSVQVHPDEAYAAAHEHDHGKTESWLVLEAEPGAFVYCGLARAVTREELAAAALDGSLCGLLRRVEVAPGDMLTIPPGTIHALSAGLTVAEVQQSSDVTYRLFDYGRLGPDGKPRALHLDKALDVCNLSPFFPLLCAFRPERRGDLCVQRLAACPFYAADRLTLSGAADLTVEDGSFLCLLCLSGSAAVASPEQSAPMARGSTVFVPAGTGSLRLEGDATLLAVTLP